MAENHDGSYELLACGVIRTAPHQPMDRRLLEIFQDLQAIIQEFSPETVAVEKLFFGRNVTNAISVGQARGTILLAAALAELEVVEYTPAEIKQAISGYGNAEKQQVQEMVRQLLNLTEAPKPDDAADGVAIAICHLQVAYFGKQ